MAVTRSAHAYGEESPAAYVDLPTYILDLGLPPRERWKHIAVHFPDLKSKIFSCISQLLDDTVPSFTKSTVKFLMSAALSQMDSDELTEELRGISDVSGCPMWALVGYNIGYDFMAGCSSGGIKAEGENGKEEMFHYRNLDWHMEATRQTTIKVIYMRGGKSILEAVHYFGMIGIATGVR